MDPVDVVSSGRVRGGNYVAEVHGASRICGAGPGGQAVGSDANKTLIGESLPDGVSLRDLGLHRVKDLTSDGER